jgi:hypothetical protein
MLAARTCTRLEKALKGGIRRQLIAETSVPAAMPLLMQRNGAGPLSMPINLGIQVLDDYGRAP